jgi:OTU domain-containing protein 7
MDSITNGHARVDAEEASSKKNKNHHGSSSLPKQMVLVRGFSRVQANEEIINETRSQIESSLYYSDSTTAEQDVDSRRAPLRIVTELPDYSFMLPDLNKFDAINYKFKEYLQNDLIELPTQYALTESGHLNWWAQNEWEQVNRSLYPMVTSGDGNCLLHAASLAMWGLHDRYLILRKALHASLEQIKEGNESALWRRWKWEQMCQNRKYGLVYNEDEWAKEWQSLLKLSSYQPRVSMGSKTVNAAAATTTASSSSSSSTASSNSSTNHQAWV